MSFQDAYVHIVWIYVSRLDVDSLQFRENTTPMSIYTFINRWLIYQAMVDVLTLQLTTFDILSLCVYLSLC